MFFSEKEKKMMLDLFHLYAPSKKEGPVLDFIKMVLSRNSIPFEQDSNGNIICLNHKGEPLLSAHTDCVGTEEAGHYVDIIDIYPYGDDEVLKGIGNIGGDDKCGVFLILLYMLSGKPINAVFSICEEIGGLEGIKTIVKEYGENEIWKSIPYAIVLDRKNPGDIISSKNSYCSDAFEAKLAEIGKKFGFSSVPGGVSDMNTLRDYFNGCNLSVGYFNPHSNLEFVSLKDLRNTYDYLKELIEKMPRDLPLEKPKPVSYGGYGYCGNYNRTKYDYTTDYDYY